jgi:hypothetical protein
MTEGNSGPQYGLDEILERLEAARAGLIAELEAAGGKLFDAANAEGDSLKRTLERTVDDVNFYYGRLVARALNLPQPPCLVRAQFSSLREATTALLVAHRRFSNLLHDLIPEDLEKTAADEEHGLYTLRQVLEMAIAHYKLRRGQVQHLLKTTAG